MYSSIEIDERMEWGRLIYYFTIDTAVQLVTLVDWSRPLPLAALRRGESHVHCNFINLIKLPNEGTLIFLVPASNHFTF